MMPVIFCYFLVLDIALKLLKWRGDYLLRFKELEEEEKQVKQDLEDAMEENRSLSIEKTVLCDELNKWKIKYDNCPTNYNVYKHTHLNIHIKITAAILSIDILFTEVNSSYVNNE